MKAVINRKYGGFGLSNAAIKLLHGCPHIKLVPANEYFGKEGSELEAEIAGYAQHMEDIPIVDRVVYVDNHEESEARTCPKLVAVVESLGEQANGRFAGLRIVELPDDVQWHVEDYDGMESIHENHRSWP